jgi:hypothetical protein
VKYRRTHKDHVSPYGSQISLREEMSTTVCFDYELLGQEQLQDYRKTKCEASLSGMQRAYRSPLQIGAIVRFV